MEYTEQKIIKKLYIKIAAKIGSPNIYAFRWESDLLMITNSGYAVEYEIKLSLSDFKADFKKKGSIKSYDRDADWKSRISYNSKSDDLLSGKGSNRFYYVCPEGLIPIEEIPDYAGLIYVTDRYIKIIKKAPLLHKNKDWKTIINKINVSNYHKLFNKL
jgi:hypothetical protein